MTDAKRRRVKVKTSMTKDEALNLAHALRDKIFLSYNLIQFIDESYLGSVKLPREGDWVGWIARVILDAANGENVPQEQSSTPEENKKLREALKPFAEWSNKITYSDIERAKELIKGGGE